MDPFFSMPCDQAQFPLLPEPGSGSSKRKCACVSDRGSPRPARQVVFQWVSFADAICRLPNIMSFGVATSKASVRWLLRRLRRSCHLCVPSTIRNSCIFCSIQRLSMGRLSSTSSRCWQEGTFSNVLKDIINLSSFFFEHQSFGKFPYDFWELKDPSSLFPQLRSLFILGCIQAGSLIFPEIGNEDQRAHEGKSR